MFEIYLSNNRSGEQQGRLWRITAPNSDQHSYLLGSMHIDGLSDGTPELNYLFRNSSSFLFEIPDENRPFDSSFALLQEILRCPKYYNDIPKKIKNLMIAYPDWQNNLAEDAHSVITFYYQHAKQPYPYNVEDLKQLNPVVLRFIIERLTIASPIQTKMRNFDHQLFASARKKQKDEGNNILVKSVEELEDEFLISLDMHIECEQDEIRKELIPGYEESDIKTMSAYEKSNIKIMKEFLKDKILGYFTGAIHKIYELRGYDAIYYQKRNEKMLSKVLPHLSQGKCFFVTGLLHCIGRNGFISLLQGAGYKVERVYETHNPTQTYFEFKLSKIVLVGINAVLDIYNFYKFIYISFLKPQQNSKDPAYLRIRLALHLSSILLGYINTMQLLYMNSLKNYKSPKYMAELITVSGIIIGKRLVDILMTSSWKRFALTSSSILGLDTIHYFYSLNRADKILNYNAPPGMLQQWKQRATELYKPLEVEGIADKSVRPVIFRTILTPYWLKNSATKAKFVNIAAQEIESKGSDSRESLAHNSFNI